jgi:hypothetical protein
MTTTTIKRRPQTSIPSMIAGYTLHLWQSTSGRIRYVYLETGKSVTGITVAPPRRWTELTLQVISKNDSIRADAAAILLWVLSAGHPLPEASNAESAEED